MGTLVGASEELKRHGGGDSSLNEYTVRVNDHLTIFLKKETNQIIYIGVEFTRYHRSDECCRGSGLAVTLPSSYGLVGSTQDYRHL